MLGQVCFCYTAAGVALEQLKHALRTANSRLCSMLKSGFVKCIGRAQAALLNFLVFWLKMFVTSSLSLPSVPLRGPQGGGWDLWKVQKGDWQWAAQATADSVAAGAHQQSGAGRWEDPCGHTNDGGGWKPLASDRGTLALFLGAGGSRATGGEGEARPCQHLHKRYARTLFDAATQTSTQQREPWHLCQWSPGRPGRRASTAAPWEKVQVGQEEEALQGQARARSIAGGVHHRPQRAHLLPLRTGVLWGDDWLRQWAMSYWVVPFFLCWTDLQAQGEMVLPQMQGWQWKDYGKKCR